MIKEHMEACDNMIEEAQKAVDLLKVLPVTRENMRALLVAEDLLETAKQYKAQTLGLYDKIFNFMGVAVK